MTSHYLAITEEAYDGAVIHGVFASERVAKRHVEKGMAPEPHTTVQEWHNEVPIRDWEYRGGEWPCTWESSNVPKEERQWPHWKVNL
jgi:hypothetical protein